MFLYKVITISILILFSRSNLVHSQIKEAQDVIRSFAPNAKVKLKIIDKENGCDVFETKATKGVITINGSSATAMCRGFYDFIKSGNYGINSWSGNRIQLPNKIPDTPYRKVVSPVEHHFYLNVVTYGYTMPYWDWERWSKEIDYMALHGIDMPLALVANEAILARVWKKLGLSDEQINCFFTAPAHLPWLRMGNLSKLDGPLPDSWHHDQIALQHKILKKMRGLEMKPICPAFAGFVPKETKDIFPDAEIVETHWAGAFNSYMLMPKSKLFDIMGTMFIKEWESEFGTNNYYLADSFNEMEIPFPEIGTNERYELLADYGEVLYNSIRNANPNAVWVMQGWMFGYQRNIWEPRSLAALCSRVPDNKMLLLDEAVDYNKHFWHNGYNWDFYGGFFNKPWIYASIPNMGGKTGLTGVLEFYANGHIAALNSANKGNLVGFGMAPEGIENNEVIYELITDAAWRSDSVDLKQWLHNYTIQRYGECTPELDSAWYYLTQSVYGTFTDHPRYNWQSRPGTMSKGTINTSPELYKAIELFSEKPLKNNLLYQADLIELTAAYVGAKLELLIAAIENAYVVNDLSKAKELEELFFDLLLSIDKLLESHPIHKMSNWIELARNNGSTPEMSDYYEKNARRLITIWGPPIDDYSARLWAGLIRDYYAIRWKLYFENKRKSSSDKYNDIAEWERNWVENQTGLSVCKPYENPIEAAESLIATAKKITVNIMPNILGNWNRCTADKELVYNIPITQLRKIRGVRFNLLKGNDRIKILNANIEMDGSVFPQIIDEVNQIVNFSIPENATGNNSCNLIINAECMNGSGNIEMLYVGE